MKFEKVLNEKEKWSGNLGKKSQIVMQKFNEYSDDVVKQTLKSAYKFLEYEDSIDKEFIKEFITDTDAFDEFKKDLQNEKLFIDKVEERIIDRVTNRVASILKRKGIDVSN